MCLSITIEGTGKSISNSHLLSCRSLLIFSFSTPCGVALPWASPYILNTKVEDRTGSAVSSDKAFVVFGIVRYSLQNTLGGAAKR